MTRYLDAELDGDEPKEPVAVLLEQAFEAFRGIELRTEVNMGALRGGEPARAERASGIRRPMHPGALSPGTGAQNGTPTPGNV
jgi:hypothetical protein